MKVKDVMTTQPVCCAGSDTVQSAAWIMKEKDFGFLPVLTDQEPRRLQGVVTDRDLCCIMLTNGKDPRKTRLEEVMTPNPAACGPEDDLNACVEIMQEHRVRRVPVVDQQGRCVGIVAQADLALKGKPEQVYETLSEISKPLGTGHRLKASLLRDE